LSRKSKLYIDDSGNKFATRRITEEYKTLYERLEARYPNYKLDEILALTPKDRTYQVELD
jgi:hypothetical protein